MAVEAAASISYLAATRCLWRVSAGARRHASREQKVKERPVMKYSEWIILEIRMPGGRHHRCGGG